MGRSHIDINKIKTIEKDDYFEYKDVVQEDFPINQYPEDGALFNREVEEGVYNNVVVANDEANPVKYRKL